MRNRLYGNDSSTILSGYANVVDVTTPVPTTNFALNPPTDLNVINNILGGVGNYLKDVYGSVILDGVS